MVTPRTKTFSASTLFSTYTAMQELGKFNRELVQFKAARIARFVARKITFTFLLHFSLLLRTAEKMRMWRNW